MNGNRKDTYRSIRDEREYGPYWYSAAWKILRPVLVGLAVAALTAGLLGIGWRILDSSFFAPVDPQDHTEYAFEITSGQRLSRVAGNLENAGLIHSKTVFKYYCDFAGMGQKIQTGSYALNKGMSMSEIAEKLTMGDGNPMVRNITLIPGESVADLARKLTMNGVLEDSAAFLEKCRTGQGFTEYYYIQDVIDSGTAGQRKYVLEGYLAPDTYEFYISASEDDILRRLLSQTEAVYTTEFQERAYELGYTMDEVLTLASLIEKEAKKADFARVSAIFHNRLKAGMRLQSDVTVHYVTGVPRMALGDQDLKVSSPYNTYQVPGLPVGPICNPSADAIRAALWPDQTFQAENYLYFCAMDPDSGTLYFSKTLAEHEQAVSRYRPLWQEYDKSRGIGQ